MADNDIGKSHGDLERDAENTAIIHDYAQGPSFGASSIGYSPGNVGSTSNSPTMAGGGGSGASAIRGTAQPQQQKATVAAPGGTPAKPKTPEEAPAEGEGEGALGGAAEVAEGEGAPGEAPAEGGEPRAFGGPVDEARIAIPPQLGTAAATTPGASAVAPAAPQTFGQRFKQRMSDFGTAARNFGTSVIDRIRPAFQGDPNDPYPQNQSLVPSTPTGERGEMELEDFDRGGVGGAAATVPSSTDALAVGDIEAGSIAPPPLPAPRSAAPGRGTSTTALVPEDDGDDDDYDEPENEARVGRGEETL